MLSLKSILGLVFGLFSVLLISTTNPHTLTAQDATVNTFAGFGFPGYAEGHKDSCLFFEVDQIVYDNAGGIIVADGGNHRIRRIGTDDYVTTVAGSGTAGYQDGPAAQAQFHYPVGVAVDIFDNIYVTEYVDASFGRRIRKISPDGMVSTVAGSEVMGFDDGNGTNATFGTPGYLLTDEQGNVYIPDFEYSTIRKLDQEGNVTTYAGQPEVFGFDDGTLETATFNRPVAMDFDSEGNMYVVDRANHAIRKITPNGAVTTFAGTGDPGYVDGSGDQAQFNQPKGIKIDQQDNVYIADRLNYLVRKITPDGMVSTVVGSFGQSGYVDGPLSNALFGTPVDILITPEHNILISDFPNNAIRQLIACSEISPLTSESYILCEPTELVYDAPVLLADEHSLEYIIHIGANDPVTGLGNIIATSNDGIFTADVSEALTPNESYKVTAVAAYDNGTELVGNSNCNTLSNTLELVLLLPLKVNVEEICGEAGTIVTLSIETTGGLPEFNENNTYRITVNGEEYESSFGEKLEVSDFMFGDNYEVSVSDNNGCEEPIISETVTCTPIGIDDVASLDFGITTIRPVPATTSAQVQLQSDKAQLLTFALFTITGQQVQQNTYQLSQGTNTVDVDLTHLANGVYFLNINGQSGQYTQKLVKQ